MKMKTKRVTSILNICVDRTEEMTEDNTSIITLQHIPYSNNYLITI